MKVRVLLLGTIALSFAAADMDAQTSPPDHFWIFLSTPRRVDASISPASLGICDRALHRRAKVLPPDRLIDERDMPVSEPAIAAIRSTGARIRTVSRWLNAVSAEMTAEQKSIVGQIPGVSSIHPVGLCRRPLPAPSAVVTSPFRKNEATTLNYGPSRTQLANINVVDLHNVGVLGEGVVVGMLDDGFNNHTTHPALKGSKVLAEYDFVQGDSNTSIAPGEYASQGVHGAGTMSAVGGYDPGSMIGAAPGVAFVLAKTEIDSVEIHAEEDNYVASLEWMERLGVDIASSSLGYRDFDPSTYSYPYSQLDGRTTIVARAASTAASKGVLLVTAMGNEGYIQSDGAGGLQHALRTIVSPADADSIIAVGATSSDAQLASFSGTGPTADGRTKPEIVAQGMAIYWADSPTMWYRYVQGTSCSTPLVAGSAALLLSVHPSLTPMAIRSALMSTATHISDGTSQTATYPNDLYGSGFENVLAAALSLGPVVSNRPLITRTDTTVTVTVWAMSGAGIGASGVQLFYRSGVSPDFSQTTMPAVGSAHQFTVVLRATDVDSTGVGYVTVSDVNAAAVRLPADAPAHLFALVATPDSIRQRLPAAENPGGGPTTLALYQNYPNPFNGYTLIRYDLPKAGTIDLSVFDILGRKVRTLVSGKSDPVSDIAKWDGRDERNVPVSSGVYIARLKTESSVTAVKMLHVR